MAYRGAVRQIYMFGFQLKPCDYEFSSCTNFPDKIPVDVKVVATKLLPGI